MSVPQIDFQKKKQEIHKDVCNISNVGQLAMLLKTRRSTINYLRANKDHFYHPKKIVKNNKSRTIDRPFDELKEMQRTIDRVFFLPLKWSEYMHGGIVGRSTKTNACTHLRQHNVLTIDLRKFFPSCSDVMTEESLKNKFNISGEALKALNDLCTYQNRIPQGGPHSMRLSCLVILPLMRELNDFCLRHDYKLSVWVDDITISGENVFHNVHTIKNIIKDYGFTISKNKIRKEKSCARQVVTGYVVNKKLSLPKEKMYKILQEIKEERKNCNKITQKSIGKLNYVKTVSNKKAEKMELVSSCDY